VNEDEAFLVGLLHDVGILAILRIAHDYQSTHGRKVPRELFEHITWEWHGHIGVRLAEAWNLPAPLPDLIGQHHADPEEDDSLRQYRWLIQLADACCDMLGYGTYEPYDLFQLPCGRGLGLTRDPATLAKLNQLPARIEERLQMF
jgi:HD-like signal output (HDOD) protein